jgi:predicted nucleic acid-binding protein
MMNMFAGNAKIMAKWQITLPKDIRDILDLPILRAAIAANADVIITGGKNFLNPT